MTPIPSQGPGSGWLLTWVAQGFGVGRVGVAPGTFGSFLGLAWFLAIMSVQSFWLFTLLTLGGLVLSVHAATTAERVLGHKDPPSVVVDEMAALPCCFFGWLAWKCLEGTEWPSISGLVEPPKAAFIGSVFLSFRVFDIWKPWPIKQVQRLPGGWGITLDDLLAALYVNGCVLALMLLRPDWVA